MKKINILHVVKSLDPITGGPAVSGPSLCRELSYLDCNIYLLTKSMGEHYAVEDYGKSKLVNKRFHISDLITMFQGVFPDLSNIMKGIDIVHLHEIWPIENAIIGNYAKQKGIKLIISPHSSLLPNDINKTFVKQIKKWLAWNIYLRNSFQPLNGVHATALNELASIKSIGFKTNVALIPNGINPNEFKELPDREVFKKYFPDLYGKKILLFFSRIEPKKGLSLLAHAWGKLAKKFPEWHLLIVGPDTDNHWAHIKVILESSCAKKQYTYSGFLHGEAKYAVLNAAQLFILPTYWENFGIVIAEAMMAKTPIITTTETPWEKIVPKRCGWIIKPDCSALVSVMEQALSLDKKILDDMGERGHEFIKSEYRWEDVAKKMREFYNYIMFGGVRPDFVLSLKGNKRVKLPFAKPIKLL
jgi:glycosyltransferase involved in cell wall biosynthesis